ncbi:CBS domain-containing protein CBSCBSPB3-like isoform X2 [Phragmites australis]|uniref:CBS domain-containing protein CBSCBSPB3-like isoform X2 n=1 Tax=Phragmites australis TaxID=29695 RepID=UPI002D78A7DE|nr:CBS domain-containing protein CBSCBSPB3-like isoform X2 [Phragmites australis]
MAAHSASQTRRPTRRAPPQPPPAAANGKASSSSKPTSPVQASLERTVKKLRLTRALTLPEATAVSGACRRMAAKRVDAALLTDANGMLSGIVTAEDIARRVIAEGLKPEETSVVKVMTRNPVFVMSNSSAIEALQKMVQGKFRHLPVVEYGEVIAMLDIKKFLYDAISRMEKAVEQGSTIAAAMEGVERQWGNDFPGPHAFMESLWEQMFKPSLSTIITENSSSKDLVLRVVAHNLSPEATLVEKAMTANPDCATSDTSILDALHSMQDGKFLHIPVVDKNGQIIACLDALQLTHAAISMVEGASGAKDVANTMMQKFWDSALAIHPAEEFDARSDESRMVASDNAEGKHMHPPHVNSSFCFKIEDKKGRMHRFSCVSESLDELVSAVAYRLGMDNEKPNIKLLYDDDEGDRVLLTTDSDLNAATQHAKSAGWKVLRLHMDESEIRREPTVSLVDPSTAERWRASLRFGIVVGAVALAGVGVIVYLKRSQL